MYLYRRIVQAKLFIDANYSKQIDLESIASHAFFSKFHFIRLFKNIYNRTPHQYLTFVRIEKAKLLLKQGVAVSEVCYSVGFVSESSFTALFKRLTGRTPSDYKRRQQQKSRDIAAVPLKGIPNCYAERFGWTRNSNFQEIAV
jgi:AraC-like DNA-binding protein